MSFVISCKKIAGNDTILSFELEKSVTGGTGHMREKQNSAEYQETKQSDSDRSSHQSPEALLSAVPDQERKFLL